MRIKKNEVLNICDKYRQMLADVSEIDLKLEEIDNVNVRKKVLSEYKEELFKEKMDIKRQIKRIDNAMTVLSEDERLIIQIVHIEGRRYDVAVGKVNLTYQRIKQLEVKAAEKMKPYILEIIEHATKTPSGLK